MKNPLLSIAALFIAASATVLGAADIAAHIAGRPKSYSVDMTMVSDGKTTKIHQAIDGDLFRVETSHDGRASVMIINKAERKMVMLMAANKMAMEMPASEDMLKKMNQDPTEEMKGKVQPVGAETIKGIVCDKFETVSEAGQKGTMWMNQADHTLVRWVNEAGKMTVDFDNYKLGAQPAGLFAVPADYKKMAMPAGAAPRPTP